MAADNPYLDDVTVTNSQQADVKPAAQLRPFSVEANTEGGLIRLSHQDAVKRYAEFRANNNRRLTELDAHRDKYASEQHFQLARQLLAFSLEVENYSSYWADSLHKKSEAQLKSDLNSLRKSAGRSFSQIRSTYKTYHQSQTENPNLLQKIGLFRPSPNALPSLPGFEEAGANNVPAWRRHHEDFFQGKDRAYFILPFDETFGHNRLLVISRNPLDIFRSLKLNGDTDMARHGNEWEIRFSSSIASNKARRAFIDNGGLVAYVDNPYQAPLRFPENRFLLMPIKDDLGNVELICPEKSFSAPFHIGGGENERSHPYPNGEPPLSLQKITAYLSRGHVGSQLIPELNSLCLTPNYNLLKAPDLKGLPSPWSDKQLPKAADILFKLGVKFDREHNKLIVHGDVNIDHMFAGDMPDFSQVTIYGNFSARHCNLSQVNNMPVVYGDIDLSHNRLTNLSGLRPVTYGSLDLSHNQLVNLKGTLRRVAKDLILNNNANLSLIGSPKEIGQTFQAQHCDLQTLKGGPVWVGKDYDVSHNDGLHYAIGCAQYIGGDANFWDTFLPEDQYGYVKPKGDFKNSQLNIEYAFGDRRPDRRRPDIQQKHPSPSPA